ncbi:sterile alpha motif domain-containing protein 9-like [Ctenopharyngodon idella]|uniref:sterile alpha motif domain-containing protein 9-like n=1 Tax=Ctenopharyngodon idella TaxID=7959 RepID=UPI0022324F88|nr:sterile alpha motif domain-containing protein 9-like [Ctenopharyngodon idella]XP_051763049.1 sterile alpha motif domain-containing protein 9-like [Ctenopharyngodon idella]XP_051763060.1 sterile alpha motif domain-containing protein 9-like [Ctenopharyngodon idella]XP_051763071.1 sterile alpha motif domain-containing protein 9-like [Ctenopharyngodon idella]
MEQREPSDSEKHAECSPHNRTSDTRTVLSKMDDWTEEDVYQWLINLKVPQKYAEMLYKQDVSGAALISFHKQDFLDVGLTHGPAVLIVNTVALFKTSSENFKHSVIPKDTDASVRTSVIQHFQPEKAAAESPTIGPAELETPTHFSIEENMGGESSVQRWSEDIPKNTSSGGEFFYDISTLQDKNDLLLEERDDGMCTKGASGAQSLALPLTQCTNNVGNETKEHLSNSVDNSKSSVFCWCKPRPFDKSSTTFVYVQNDILPPETGPSNLIDPLHEYKLMTNTEKASEKDVFKKFRDDTCWFAAACMNSRTNGTIHFGVGDEPLYKHGQIIGLEVPSQSKYINAFEKGLKEHFKENTNIAMACIRPPKFVKVKCPDNKDRWVIEIDVVPKYKLTGKKLFYTTLDKKKRKSKCLFIRSGASTINYLPENNPKMYKKNNKTLKLDLELWVSSRQLAEDHGPVPHFICTYGDHEVHETVLASSRYAPSMHTFAKSALKRQTSSRQSKRR